MEYSTLISARLDEVNYCWKCHIQRASVPIPRAWRRHLVREVDGRPRAASMCQDHQRAATGIMGPAWRCHQYLTPHILISWWGEPGSNAHPPCRHVSQRTWAPPCRTVTHLSAKWNIYPVTHRDAPIKTFRGISSSEEEAPRLTSSNTRTAVVNANGRTARRRAKERTSRNRTSSLWLDSLFFLFASAVRVSVRFGSGICWRGVVRVGCYES